MVGIFLLTHFSSRFCPKTCTFHFPFVYIHSVQAEALKRRLSYHAYQLYMQQPATSASSSHQLPTTVGVYIPWPQYSPMGLGGLHGFGWPYTLNGANLPKVEPLAQQKYLHNHSSVGRSNAHEKSNSTIPPSNHEATEFQRLREICADLVNDVSTAPNARNESEKKTSSSPELANKSMALSTCMSGPLASKPIAPLSNINLLYGQKSIPNQQYQTQQVQIQPNDGTYEQKPTSIISIGDKSRITPMHQIREVDQDLQQFQNRQVSEKQQQQQVPDKILPSDSSNIVYEQPQQKQYAAQLVSNLERRFSYDRIFQ